MRKLSVWKLSRLGRNTLEVLKTIEEFNTLGISLFIKNYNIETLNEDGKPNVMSQFLVGFRITPYIPLGLFLQQLQTSSLKMGHHQLHILHPNRLDCLTSGQQAYMQRHQNQYV